MKFLLYSFIIVLFVFGGIFVVLFNLPKKDIAYLEIPNSTNNTKPEKYLSPLSIEYLRKIKIENSNLEIERKLANGSNYSKYITSFKSEGFKVYGLLTIPMGEIPQNGFSAIVFNHGYIPPNQYKTEKKYFSYVDYLARNGFVVFKIDLRGHGLSEGSASGTYFSPAYTVDVLSALKALQSDYRINKNKIGLWGHSMSGNLVLRSMLITNEIKAGVIWAGAVYSYKDFAKYGISDNSFVRRDHLNNNVFDSMDKKTTEEVAKFRENRDSVDFNNDFWKSISLTENLKYLSAPIQIHHSINDDVVNVGYSRDLKIEMEKEGKNFELVEYKSGGHNIDSPYFEQAMKKTVEFFKRYL